MKIFNIIKAFILAFTILVAPLSVNGGPPVRTLTQTQQIFGDVGSNKSLVFKQSRKQVVYAVLHVTTAWQWNYSGWGGPTSTVSIDYQNTQLIAGNLNTANYSLSVYWVDLPPATGYQYNVNYDVVIDPATLTGTGNLVLPVVTTAATQVEIGYTVIQAPQFVTTAILEYQTGR